MDSVPDKGQKAIPSQLVVTVKPSNAVTTRLESAGSAPKGEELEGEGPPVYDPGASTDARTDDGPQESTAKDQVGCSHFVIEYPVFPPSAAKK
eukprot:2911133-Amphidinium_carterae.1